MFHSEVELRVWGCGGGRVGVSCGAWTAQHRCRMMVGAVRDSRWTVGGVYVVCMARIFTLFCLPSTTLRRSVKDDIKEPIDVGDAERLLPWIGLSTAGFVTIVLSMACKSKNKGGLIDGCAVQSRSHGYCVCEACNSTKRVSHDQRLNLLGMIPFAARLQGERVE
jgi:hypothetical protein